MSVTRINGETVISKEWEAIEYASVEHSNTLDELAELFGDGHLVTTLIGEIRSTRSQLADAVEQLATANERIKELKRFLRRYGEHKFTCATRLTYLSAVQMPPCDCGLAKLIGGGK